MALAASDAPCARRAPTNYSLRDLHLLRPPPWSLPVQRLIMALDMGHHDRQHETTRRQPVT